MQTLTKHKTPKLIQCLGLMQQLRKNTQNLN